MGNRAVITTRDREHALYVHYNGGRKSIEGFLKYCELRQFRPPEVDSYGWARLCQVIANFFGADGHNVGIAPYMDDTHSDPGDNGIYVISNWHIVEHFGGTYEDDEPDEDFDMDLWLETIDARQPKGQQLGPDGLKARWVRGIDLRVGDQIFVLDINNDLRRVTFCETMRFPNSPDCAAILVDLHKNAYGAPDSTPWNVYTEEMYRRI